MNNKILLALLGVAMLFTACENYDDIIPEKFSKIMALKEVGVQNITLYTTGEDGNFEITVMKGGSEPSTSATAEIVVMTEAELASYSTITGKKYDALPASTFTINEPSINFDGSVGYNLRNVILKTNAIDELFTKNPDANYVIPLLLTSRTDSVNVTKNTLLIKPRVVVPVINYETSNKTVNTKVDKEPFEFRLALPFASPWDFDATLEVVPGMLPAGYTLLPTDHYTMEGTKVVFKKGNSLSEPLPIKIKTSSTKLVGNNNVLPIKVKSSTIAGIKIPEAPFMLYATEYNEIPLTVDMLSTNAAEPAEGPIKDLVDRNPGTYFHSAYTWSVGAPHAFTVSLTKNISTMSFKYQNRNNSNGKPQDIIVWVEDSTGWVKLDRIDNGLPAAAGSIYSSKTYVAERPFNKVKIEVMRTNSGNAPTFFNMAEFYLYGI